MRKLRDEEILILVREYKCTIQKILELTDNGWIGCNMLMRRTQL